jgi:outer membrane protein assembly factor BamD (BamD/ComL family)
MAAFMAEVKPAVVPPPVSDLPQQKLLFEAAAKAAEAGEPVLSIQLYARLLARFPDSAFAAQARAAVEAQKLKLAKP